MLSSLSILRESGLEPVYGLIYRVNQSNPIRKAIMSKYSRRRFLEDSLMMLTAASLSGPLLAEVAKIPGKRKGANEQINIAVIGCGGRGGSHLNAFLGMADVNLVAVCDADEARMEGAVALAEKNNKPAPKMYRDVRDLLKHKDLDAVSIATTNHWHALGAIWAMQAGKDVYVEKPASHNVCEGCQMVKAARKYNRICQVGTQSRSNPGMRDAMQYLHDGKLGKISLARGLCYKPRPSIGLVTEPQPIPASVNYDLWLGPAPQKKPMRQRFHYDWHWFWDYGNGDLGNQGSHEMDKARWGLNRHELPKSVIGYGGRFGYKDSAETPNTEVLVLDYGEQQIIFEVRGLPTEALKAVGVGNIWYGTEGYMVAPSYSGAAVYDNAGKEVTKFGGGGDHFRNFIDAVRSGKSSDLNCDIEDGHLSAALCHMGNVSFVMGADVPFDPITKAFGDNKEASETYVRFEEHLKANGVDLSAGTYRLGKGLKFDPKSETFIGDPKANEIMKGTYRAPFVVPKNV